MPEWYDNDLDLDSALESLGAPAAARPIVDAETVLAKAAALTPAAAATATGLAGWKLYAALGLAAFFGYAGGLSMNTGDGENSYSEGFARGVIAGKNKKTKDTKSSSVTFRGADKTLVEGAKAAAPKFNDYSKGVSETFSNIPSKSSSNNNSTQYSSPRETSKIYDRATLNSLIRSAKLRKKSTKKVNKDLLKILLKTGKIKKGDERYLVLKAKADYGYDPKTEEDPEIFAINSWRKLNDEKLYGGIKDSGQ